METQNDEVVSHEDVIRMICIGALQNPQGLDIDTISDILEATNRRHILDAARAFVDAGGLDDEDEDDEDEIDSDTEIDNDEVEEEVSDS